MVAVKRPLHSAVDVRLITETLIGTAHTAAKALTLIGSHWDESPGMRVVSGHYEFEMDYHRFVVTVIPTDDPLRRAADELEIDLSPSSRRVD
jgi:hypothetical protein